MNLAPNFVLPVLENTRFIVHTACVIHPYLVPISLALSFIHSTFAFDTFGIINGMVPQVSNFSCEAVLSWFLLVQSCGGRHIMDQNDSTPPLLHWYEYGLPHGVMAGVSQCVVSYGVYVSHPAGAAFPSSIARQPRACQYCPEPYVFGKPLPTCSQR